MIRLTNKLSAVKNSDFKVVFNTISETFIFIPNEAVGENRQDATEQDLITASSNKKILCYDYPSFISVIREATARRIPSEFTVIYDNSKLYVFQDPMYTQLNQIPICIYTPESDAILDFALKLFRIDDNKNFVRINSTVDNYYSFIAPWQVLEVLFAKADIEGNGEEMFTKFYKPKKDGGQREIIAPHEKIKAALQDLNAMLQKVYDKRNSDFQVAYKKNKNVKSGAKIHTNHKYIFNLDLHNFYPSCKKELVKKYTDFLFAFSFNRKFIEDEFFKVITIDDGLFIGSPVSGTLANTIISSAVSYMNNICKKHGMTLSVYADDISISSDKFIVKDFAIKLFNEAFGKYNLESYFTLNEKKSVGFSGCNRKVTGVTINGDDKITVSRKYYRNIRVEIDHLSKGDSSIDIQVLRGKIAYATMLDESGKIYNYLNKYIDTVKEYNLCSDEKMAELAERLGKKEN